MQEIQQPEPLKKPTTPKKKQVLKKLDPDSAKLLQALSEDFFNHTKRGGEVHVVSWSFLKWWTIGKFLGF